MFAKIFNSTHITEKALDAAWMRNDVISENITNVDTPGYKKKFVRFEEYLKENLDNKNKDSNLKNADIKPIVYTDNSNSSMRLDGNNVDIDSEMAFMAKNTIKYNVLVQGLNSSLRMLKSAINEGRR